MPVNRRTAPLLLIVGQLLTCNRVTAQVSTPLPVQGTVAVALLVHDVASDDVTGLQAHFRWTGRVAIRVSKPLYLGIAGGSWEQQVGILASNASGVYSPDDSLAAVSGAVTYSAYAQYYPMQSIVFLRAAGGIAATSTYYPFGDVIFVQSATRPSLSAGIGADFRVHGPLYVTGAFDYTYLFGVDGGLELESAAVFSVGLTIR